MKHICITSLSAFSPHTRCRLLKRALDAKLRLPKLIRSRVLNLELLERTHELRLDLLLSAALLLHADLRTRDRALDLVDVGLKIALRLMARAEIFVRLLELLRVLDHLLNFHAREATDRVGDADGCLTARSTVHRRDLQQTVRVNLEGRHELRLSTRHRWDTVELELAQQAVVPTLSALALVHWERDGRLVILNGCERTALVRRNRCVTWDDHTKYIALHGNTEREGRDVKEQQVCSIVRSLASYDSSLNRGTVRNGFIRIDGLVERTGVEELGD